MSLLDRIPDQRILKGAPATLRAVLVDQDGEADTTVDSGVTVTVTRLDGTVLVSAQPATVADGVATYALTAAQTGAGLDVLTAAWTHDSVVRVTTRHEVVGRFWFAPSALLSIKGVEQALQSTPGEGGTAGLVAARTWIESLIEQVTGVAWVPRVARDELDVPDGSTVVRLRHMRPRSLVSVSIDGTAETLADWTVDEWGGLRRVDGGTFSTSDARGLVVQYEHGFDAPPPALREAAIVAAADRIKRRVSTIGDRATQLSNDGVVINLGRFDPQHPTGIPEVDAVILAHDHTVPGMA